MTTNTFEAELSCNASRLLYFGMTYGDFRSAAEGAASWEGWSERVEAQAGRYQALAEDAHRGRRVPTAIDAWRRSAAYHHFAQFRLRESDRKWDLQQRSREAFARAAPLMSPPAYEVEHGYLRVAKPGAPCVLLINGLDSAKEVELAGFAEGFLQRGCSVFFFDGPGQGQLSGQASLAKFELAASAVIDMLSGDEWLGPVPFGLFGVSYGGYLACRTAARDPRVQATVCLGGFHDGSIFAHLPPHAVDIIHRAYRLERDAAISALDGSITLEGSRGQLRSPLLVVHGTADHLVDQEQVRRLAAWAGPLLAEIWNVDGAEHVCTDRFGEYLPRLWDWMAGKLARGN